MFKTVIVSLILLLATQAYAVPETCEVVATRLDQTVIQPQGYKFKSPVELKIPGMAFLFTKALEENGIVLLFLPAKLVLKPNASMTFVGECLTPNGQLIQVYQDTVKLPSTQANNKT